MSSNNTSSGGTSFLTLLSIVFITLKLTNVIDWSWWYVLAPIWGGLALFLVIVIIILIVKLVLSKKYKAKIKEYELKKQERPKSRFQRKLDEMMKEAREKQNK